MKERVTPRYGPRRTGRSSIHSGQGRFNDGNAIAEGIGVQHSTPWVYAVHRLSVYRQGSGNERFVLFETPLPYPLLFAADDIYAIQNEVDLRRSALSRGIYHRAELEVLWLSTTIPMAHLSEDPETAPAVPLKIFTADIPELGACKGDVQLGIGERYYWVAPDWRTLFPNRPAEPLSAILLPDEEPFPADGITETGHPKAGLKIRFPLPYPLVVERPRARRNRRESNGPLKLCLSRDLS